MADPIDGEHASIVWSNEEELWTVRDLGSRHGTFVDGERIEPGLDIALGTDSTIAFGAEGDTWRLQSTAPPGVVVVDPTSGDAIAAQDDLLSFPHGGPVEVTIYQGLEGWMIERDERVERIRDQTIFSAAGRGWCIHIPRPRFAVGLDDVRLVLDAAGDRPTAEILGLDAPVVLEDAPTTRLLTALARAFRDGTDDGWVEVSALAKTLGVDAAGVDALVLQLRQLILSKGVQHGATIVEVRPGHRRIGTTAFEFKSATSK